MAPVVAQDQAVETSNIRYELITSLPVEEVWHTAADTFDYLSTGGVFVAYLPAGHENEPVDGDWISPGYAMFGLGDVAEIPVALRIWTKGEDRFLEALSRAETENGYNGVLLFGPSENDVSLRITAEPDGDVSVNGKVVGSLGSQ